MYRLWQTAHSWNCLWWFRSCLIILEALGFITKGCCELRTNMGRLPYLAPLTHSFFQQRFIACSVSGIELAPAINSCTDPSLTQPPGLCTLTQKINGNSNLLLQLYRLLGMVICKPSSRRLTPYNHLCFWEIPGYLSQTNGLGNFMEYN